MGYVTPDKQNPNRLFADRERITSAISRFIRRHRINPSRESPFQRPFVFPRRVGRQTYSNERCSDVILTPETRSSMAERRPSWPFLLLTSAAAGTGSTSSRCRAPRWRTISGSYRPRALRQFIDQWRQTVRHTRLVELEPHFSGVGVELELVHHH